MKKTLIIGNWKMHLNVQQASLLVHRLNTQVALHRNVEVVLAPNMLALQPVSLEIDRRKFRLSAQDANATDEGALTGEVSFTMLRDLVHYCIVGHSERRAHFNNTLEVVRDKVQAAVRNEIVPIICVGETSTERHAHETKRVLHDQVSTALHNLTGVEVEKVVIAYEPVWAIGTGEAAKPAAIAAAVQTIRHTVSQLYGANVADSIRILYGGSVEPEVVSGILAINGIDGFLVGGASLNYQQFAGIVSRAHAHNTSHRDGQ